ncbi:ankyrin repeat protein [Magpiepox virus]|nr:ankyrin repeat protein [Magpiepox virus]
MLTKKRIPVSRGLQIRLPAHCEYTVIKQCNSRSRK